MASLVDDQVAAQLNTFAAHSIQRLHLDADQAATRLRDSFSQDGRALGALIGIKLVQASDPGTDTDFNAAVRTPYAVGPAGEMIPSAAVAQK